MQVLKRVSREEDLEAAFMSGSEVSDGYVSSIPLQLAAARSRRVMRLVFG